MYILAVAESIDEMRVTAQMCHDAEFYLRVVSRYDDSVRPARYKSLSDFLAPLCPYRYVLQIRF